MKRRESRASKAPEGARECSTLEASRPIRVSKVVRSEGMKDRRKRADSVDRVSAAREALEALDIEERRRLIEEFRFARSEDAPPQSRPETTEEARLIGALFEPPDLSISTPLAEGKDGHFHDEWSAFRELFPHRLEGVDDQLLENVRHALRLTSEALATNDLAALQQIASIFEESRKHHLVVTAHDVVHEWLENFSDDPETLGWLGLRLVGILKAPGSAAVFDELAQRAREARAKRTGYGVKGARNLTGWLIYALRAFGITSEKKADELVSSALKAAQRSS